MPVQTITGPSGQQLTQGQAQSIQKQSAAQYAIQKARAAVTASLAPGWVILLVGTAGYLLSETRIFGPILAILLAIGTIFQLNQYVQSKGGPLL